MFTANGEGLAATYNGANGVKAWSISARQVAGDIANFSLKSADFNWDSSTLVGGGYNGELKSWNTISNQVLATYNGHTDTINGVLYSPNRKHVASISKDKTLRLWQADNGKQLAVFRGPGEIESLAFSPNGGHLVIGGTGGKITLLSIKTGASTNSKPITPSVPPRVQTPAPPPTRVYRPAPAPVPTQVQRPKTVPSVPAAQPQPKPQPRPKPANPALANYTHRVIFYNGLDGETTYVQKNNEVILIAAYNNNDVGVIGYKKPSRDPQFQWQINSLDNAIWYVDKDNNLWATDQYNNLEIIGAIEPIRH